MDHIFARGVAAIGQPDAVAADVKKIPFEDFFGADGTLYQVRKVHDTFPTSGASRLHERRLNKYR